jgi:hypothetical protein
MNKCISDFFQMLLPMLLVQQAIIFSLLYFA